MYYSLVYPYLSYCSLVWGKAYDTHLKPLEILQKRCIRVINSKPFLEHSEPLFFSNEILKLKDVYRFKLACFMHKLPNLNQFLNSHNYETRYRNHLQPQYHRLSVCQQSISYHGPKLWNEIPLAIKSNVKLPIFKKQYKTFLLSGYI